MRRAVHIVILATLVLIVALGCQNTLSGGPDPFDPNLGRLTVTIASSVQAADITTPDMAIANYLITLSGPGNPAPVSVPAGTTSYTFFSLEPGVWTVTVDGYNAGSPGDLIGQGSAPPTNVSAGQRIIVPVAVAPLDGSGTLDLSISWPEGLYDLPEVVASLIPQGAVVGEPLLFSPGTNPATYNALHGVGYYELSIALLDDEGIAAWSRRYALRIVANLETTGSFALTATDITTGAIDVVITEEMNNPYSVSFTGFETDLSNGPMIVGVELDPIATPDEVRWYLNGVLEETAATITIVAGSGVGELAPGTYWLDAIVTVSTTLSSYGQSFAVQ